jgi:hypothetical protein
METDLEGVLAAGEVVTGGTGVVDAVVEGRRAATAIHRLLGGEEGDLGREHPRPRRRVARRFPLDGEAGASRPPEPTALLALRKVGFGEVVETLSPEAAMKEARRCSRCDLD